MLTDSLMIFYTTVVVVVVIVLPFLTRPFCVGSSLSERCLATNRDLLYQVDQD